MHTMSFFRCCSILRLIRVVIGWFERYLVNNEADIVTNLLPEKSLLRSIEPRCIYNGIYGVINAPSIMEDIVDKLVHINDGVYVV